MNRRSLVQLLPLALVGCTQGAGGSAGSGSPDLLPGQYTDFNVWLKAARAAATHLVEERGARDPARFVQFLALWAGAMPRFVVRGWQEIKGANSKLEVAVVAPGRPFAVSAFRMAPGCIQPVHCHPGSGGVTLCNEGSVVIKHFDLLPGSAEYSNTGGPAEIAEVSISHVHSGRFTTFTPSAGNLHQLEAGPEVPWASIFSCNGRGPERSRISNWRKRQRPRKARSERVIRAHGQAWTSHERMDERPAHRPLATRRDVASDLACARTSSGSLRSHSDYAGTHRPRNTVPRQAHS